MSRLRRLFGLVGPVGLVALLGTVVFGQAPAPFTPAATSESFPGGTLLLVAYAFAWAVILGYVFMLWRKSTRIDRELMEVTAKLNARSAKR
jgi:CcmD family protein